MVQVKGPGEEAGRPSAAIVCQGVRTHNLKGIDVEIPLYKWTAITGVSGSGKSSLVFDTLYAEAQRRFLETLGTYERQFLQGLPQGEFDLIDNIPAAVALKQTNRSSDPRSLIGTASDVLEPMRTLFTALMDPSCVRCGSPAETHKSTELIDHITALGKVPKASAEHILLTVPFQWPADLKKRKEIAKNLMLEGYIRVLSEAEVVNIEEAMNDGSLAKLPTETDIVLDRVAMQTDADELINRVETIWSQVRFSTRFSMIHATPMQARKALNTGRKIFMVQPFCAHCNATTSLIQSSDLDWQSVLGACAECRGMGNVPIIDVAKVVPNPKLSLRDGALKPWSSETFSWMNDTLLRVCKANGVKTDVPFEALDERIRQWIWTGADPQSAFKKLKDDFVSVQNFFEVLEAERYKRNSRILLAKYRKYITCKSCEGLRLGMAGRNARCAGVPFYQLMQQEVSLTHTWVNALQRLPGLAKKLDAVSEIYKEVDKKISLLHRLGLGSSTLARRCRTLSGGEYQRVLLSRVLGNGLTDAMYVLDEPSIGLGKDEIPELVACIRELRDLGNTVVMVEHEPSLVLSADSWIELGQGGGAQGGTVMPPKGPRPASMAIDPKVLQQAPTLVGARTTVGPDILKLPGAQAVVLKGFTMLNCKNLTLEIPLGRLSVISGPSGAGKSTLVHGGLEAALVQLFDNGLTANSHLDLDEGIGLWSGLVVPKDFIASTQLVSVEQRAMHRTITSVPATVLGLMDGFRKMFAATDGAKEAGLSASDFSFNGAGACLGCNGRGAVKEDLFFLGEVDKTCPDCQGSRYRPDVQDVRWLGKSINQWLSLSLAECFAGLKKHASLARPLHLALQLGLGHLPLGVSTTAISGGEAQRLRICAALSKSEQKIFCILDEPTRGLSEKDIGDLLVAILQLCSQGHTFVVVEHHDQFQNTAHQLVRLGPGGGAAGGTVTGRELRM